MAIKLKNLYISSVILEVGKSTGPRLCCIHLCVFQLPNTRPSMEKVQNKFMMTGVRWGDGVCVCVGGGTEKQLPK